MDYEGLYRDLIRIGERAYFRLLFDGLAATADLMDEAAKFRTDIRNRGLLNTAQVQAAVKDAAIVFKR